MVRIAEARAPASPVSKSQIARQKRILGAAAAIGARKRIDVVQMQEVAKDANVAIATLYRYFPSKNALFAAVFQEEINTFHENWRPDEDGELVDRVTDLLVGLSRHLLLRPILAAAMFQATNAVYVAVTMDEVRPTESGLSRILLCAMGVEEPGEQDLTLVRLLMYCWWGALVSTLGGQTTSSAAEADIRSGARLLLASYAEKRRR